MCQGQKIASKNSVWRISNSDLFEDGLYRLLDILQDIESIILFSLENSSTIVRPVAVSLESFIELVSSRKAKQTQYELPAYLLVDEENTPEGYISRRDKNYGLIEGVIFDQTFIFDYATKKRFPQLSEHAREMGVDRKSLARLLTLYWRYGQNKMALLPAFANSGGFGRERMPTSKPLGAPKQPRTLALERSRNPLWQDSCHC